jgi:signal transduction histidine kinase
VHHPALVATATVIGHAIAAATLVSSRRAWARDYHPVDWAMSIAAAAWLLHLLVTSLLPALHVNHEQGAHIAQAGYQAIAISGAFFLLVCAGANHPRALLVLIVQGVAGTALLLSDVYDSPQSDSGYVAWIAVNLIGSSFLTVYIAASVRRNPSFPNWVALVTSMVGLGLWLQGGFADEDQLVTASLSHCFYAAFPVLTWQLVKQRGLRFGAPESSDAGDFRSTGLEPVTGFGPSQWSASQVVENERRRIAQDLHDGVGSQIVSILSTLGRRSSLRPEALAFALEQCLLDLKMTVDGLDSEGSVLEKLGQLRYRMQHSLDRRDIRMDWKVEPLGELDTIRGFRAQQMIRIAQESLANVMRHADASMVQVSCRVVRSSGDVALEIRDNGSGIDRSKMEGAGGRGLQNMRRRARAIGGELVIQSRTGAGTRVRLTMPIQ